MNNKTKYQSTIYKDGHPIAVLAYPSHAKLVCVLFIELIPQHTWTVETIEIEPPAPPPEPIPTLAPTSPTAPIVKREFTEAERRIIEASERIDDANGND